MPDLSTVIEYDSYIDLHDKLTNYPYNNEVTVINSKFSFNYLGIDLIASIKRKLEQDFPTSNFLFSIRVYDNPGAVLEALKFEFVKIYYSGNRKDFDNLSVYSNQIVFDIA